MKIEFRVVECTRDSASASWRRRVLHKEAFEIEGNQSDTLHSFVCESTQRGEPLRVIVHEVYLLPEERS